MKRILVIAVLASAAASLTLGQTSEKPDKQADQTQPTSNKAEPATEADATGGNVEQTLMQMEREISNAEVKGDTATLERMWAEGYSFTNPGGAVMKKAEYIEALKSGALKFETLDLADMKVRVTGDTAEVTGRVTVKGKFKDEAFSEVDSYTNVYAKQQGQWQLVSTKVTSGAGQQPSEQQSPQQQPAQQQPAQEQPTQQPTQEKPTQQQPT